jgi:hypothetical protein
MITDLRRGPAVASGLANTDVPNIPGAKHMKRFATLRSLIAGLGVAIVAVACAPENLAGPRAPQSSPSVAVAALTGAPVASASTGLLGTVVQLSGAVVQTTTSTISNLLYPVVQRQRALDHSITVTGVIGAAGGTISIAEAGLTVTFSRGAVSTPTLITVTADAGSAVSYEFGPHGIQFNAPVTIRQDMSLTTLVDDPAAASSIRGGYTADGLSDVIGGLLARVAELLNATTTTVVGPDGSIHLGTSSFIIKHFSGYILIGA